MKVFRHIISRLAARYDEREARALARLLLEERCSLSMAAIAMDADEALTDNQKALLQADVLRLEQGEPLQYIIGKQAFAGCTFHVGPAVLIPRPETEQLVGIISSDLRWRRPGIRMLDIGTGSGCIAVSLARKFPQAHVSAWDVSPEALQVARANAALNQAAVDFSHQDALRPPADSDLWDLIVSNPPYVCLSERCSMEPHVADHEPPLALFVPDDDPLLFYRAIASYAARALRPAGMLYFEINPLFAADMQALLSADSFQDIELMDDLYGKQRFIKCHKDQP